MISSLVNVVTLSALLVNAKTNLRSEDSAPYTSAVECFGPFNIMCWQHTTDVTAGTITFNATCTDALFAKVAFCAFGLSLSGSSSMGNAEVFWVSVLSNGVVSVEDRFNPKGHDAPVCVTQQSKGNGSVDPKTGIVTATWVRPLNATGEGFASISSGSSFRTIAAWGTSSQQATPCQMGWHEHKYTGSGSTTF